MCGKSVLLVLRSKERKHEDSISIFNRQSKEETLFCNPKKGVSIYI